MASKRVVFDTALDAPGAPDVQDPGPARELARAEHARRVAEHRQLECRRGLAEQCRHHRALVRRMRTPTYSTPASARNTTTGRMKRFKWPRPQSWTSLPRSARLTRPVAPVAGRERAAQRHESGREPHVVDERPQLRAHAPAAGAQVLAQRREQVHVPARVDARLGHASSAAPSSCASPDAAPRPARRRAAP